LRAIAAAPIVPEQLNVVVGDDDDVRLQWRSMQAHRLNSKQPTLIELRVPREEISSQSGWEFKAGILTNFLGSDAQEAHEPLRTRFLQTLCARNYEIAHVSNAVLSDAAVAMRFASRVVLEGLRIQAQMQLHTEELYISNAEIVDSKLDLKVERGVWRNVYVHGTACQLSGELGDTLFDDQCRFTHCYLDVDLRRATFLGDDFWSRLENVGVKGSCASDQLRGVATPMSAEKKLEFHRRLTEVVHERVGIESWRRTEDRR
jgi:hypothetical protein